MLFSSITFLYYFLPIVLIFYLVVPKQAKNYVLLIGSLIFYTWGEPRYILLMAATIIVGYISGILIEKFKGNAASKALMIVSVCLCLGVLALFKYADFFINSINYVSGSGISLLKLALPIGISFYTFQLLSYVIDVYKGRCEAQRNIVKLAVYICMFPQLIAGPIVRYTDIQGSLSDRKITLNKISYGITRFCTGLGKKVLIANTLGELKNVYNGQMETTVVFTWLYVVAISLQLYFDFSGYSDMAIGLGSILGFEFPENFDHPFMAKSVTEFWRRWHMTLGKWFRDYLYIPMGGNRVKPARHIFNILIVWMATGLWHGASWNFVVWGLVFAVLLILEKYVFLKIGAKSGKHEKSTPNNYAGKFIGHVYLLIVVAVSFVIFDNVSLADGFARIGYIFGAGGIQFANELSWFYLKDYLWIIVIGCIGATSLPAFLIGKLKLKGEKAFAILEPLFCAAILLLSTAFLINGSFNPFLYFRF